MQIQVVVEPMNGTGYVARTGAPYNCDAEGATEDEAVRNLQDEVSRRIAGGAKVLSIFVPGAGHPLAKWVGTWKPDDPMLKEWAAAVERHRAAIDADPNVV